MAWWRYHDVTPWGYDDKFAWETSAEARQAIVLTSTFTPEEIMCLRALRERYQATCDSDEFGLDVRRLRYARWLVEHGRISEGVEGV